jgi:hypothetical protein
MKTKILLVCFLFLVGGVAFAQVSDSTESQSENYYAEYDTAYQADDSTSYFVGAPNPDATYNINDPAQLPITKNNNAVSHKRHDFDKLKWKEIVGETTFNQEKEKEKKENPASRASVWSGALLKAIAYGSIFIIIIVVFYFLIRNAFKEEVRNKKNKNGESLLFDNHIDEVVELDLEALLRQALAAGDFKSAVRLYYIRLLKHLHDAKFITWKKDKTNRDYSYELSKTTFIQRFQKITLAYEVIWYGEHTPTAEDFEILQQNFIELQQLTSTSIA